MILEQYQTKVYGRAAEILGIEVEYDYLGSEQYRFKVCEGEQENYQQVARRIHRLATKHDSFPNKDLARECSLILEDLLDAYEEGYDMAYIESLVEKLKAPLLKAFGMDVDATHDRPRLQPCPNPKATAIA